MFVRLYSNMIQTLLTFYLASVLEFKDPNVESVKTPIQMAIVPLSLFLLSIITSTQLGKMYMFMGKKWALTIGTFFCLITSIALIFISKDNRNLIYVVAPCIGIGQAITLNTGLIII
jgi:Na+/melibiose symporter-like transporter